MKILSIVGLFVAIIVACAFLHWRQVKISEFDGNFRQNLPGTWLREEDNLPRGVGMPSSMQCTNIVTADGNFIELSWFSHSDRTNTYQRTGTWTVKNGHLIETVKTSTNPTEVTPHTGTSRIISANKNEFILHWPNSTNQVWQKIIR